jgi:hypothetical protein
MSDTFTSDNRPRPEVRIVFQDGEDGRGRDISFVLDDPSPERIDSVLAEFIGLCTSPSSAQPPSASRRASRYG